MLSIRAVYFGLPVLHALLICKLRLSTRANCESAFLARGALQGGEAGGNGRALPEEERQGAASAGVAPERVPPCTRLRWRVAERGCIPGSGEIWRPDYSRSRSAAFNGSSAGGMA